MQFHLKHTHTNKRGVALYTMFWRGVELPFLPERLAGNGSTLAPVYLLPRKHAEKYVYELNYRASMFGGSWSFALREGEGSQRSERYAKAYGKRNACKIYAEYRAFCRTLGITCEAKIDGMKLKTIYEQ